MRIRVLVSCVVLLAGVAAGGCRRSASNEPPVATPALSLARSRVPLGSPLTITYEFKVAPQAKFDRDYRVFVHFKDADEELMWTDDHYPPTPTSQWKPGDTIKYSRLIFVPVYPYVGEASVDLGLYDKDKRLPLQGTDRGSREYRVTKFQVAPQTENIYLTFKDGWHLAEMAPDNASNEWHWTKKDATISFKNPKKDVLLYLDLDGTTKLLPEAQVVTLRVGDQVITSFALGARPELRRIPIGAAQLGMDEKVDLKIEVDKTFVPTLATGGAQRDPRELGVRVFHAYVEAQ